MYSSRIYKGRRDHIKAVSKSERTVSDKFNINEFSK
jgi:hypothetical protein